MKSLVKVLMVLSLAAVICLPATAFATVASIDETFITNSWGQKWGDNGFYLMSPSVIASPQTSDLWVPQIGIEPYKTVTP